MLDASAFNFDTIKEVTGDPFAEQTNKYGADERFYTLSKDKDGNGAAVIRFMIDSEKGTIQELYKINTTITKNGKKRFVSEYSPSKIGQPCPFQEKWQELWNAGDKEGAKVYGRGIKYIANIKVIKDPANPENEGKIFLYEMSGKMKDKLKAALEPSEQDKALGATTKELFNPLAGNSFRLVAKKGANGQINYDSSEIINEVSSVYNSVEEALTDIKENTYKLSDLLKPESFMTYEQLQDKMRWVNFEDVQPTQTVVAEVAQPQVVQPEVQPSQTTQVTQPQVVQPVESGSAMADSVAAAQGTPTQPVAQPAQAANNNLDDLLAGLM